MEASKETTEKRLRQHLHDACKVARDVADSIKFERVHRSPGSPISGKVRNIVAKFTYFKDRESVRKCWKELDGTVCIVFSNNFHRTSSKNGVNKMKELR